MYRAPELSSQYASYLESHERKSASESPSFYGLAVDVWSVGMLFSELLLCACGRRGEHLLQGFLFRPRSHSSNYSGSRQKSADEERQRMNYVLEQVGLEKLKITLNCCASSPPDDFPVAIDLLNQMLQKEWQGEGARICAGKALEHKFFSRDASAAVTTSHDPGEEKCFKHVRKLLRQIERVR